MYVSVLLVQLSVSDKRLARNTSLRMPIHGKKRLSPQSPGCRECLCIYFLFCLFMLLCVPHGPSQYIYVSYSYAMIQPICAESAIKYQPTFSQCMQLSSHSSTDNQICRNQPAAVKQCCQQVRGVCGDSCCQLTLPDGRFLECSDVSVSTCCDMPCTFLLPLHYCIEAMLYQHQAARADDLCMISILVQSCSIHQAKKLL